MELAGCDDLPVTGSGRSLVPLLRGDESVRMAWYGLLQATMRSGMRAIRFGMGPEDCRSYMVRMKRAGNLCCTGFRPQLFDMENDPGELNDLGGDPDYEVIRREMSGQAVRMDVRKRELRTALSNADIAKRTGSAKRGYFFGVW